MDKISRCIEEFIHDFRTLARITLESPMRINKKSDSRVVVDKQGYIWIYEEDGENCVRTTVNVENGKFKTTGCGGAEGFYFICKDGTGLHFNEDDIYYLIAEEYSGWGSAFEHFKQFPDGDSRLESLKTEYAMLQWAMEQQKDAE